MLLPAPLTARAVQVSGLSGVAGVAAGMVGVTTDYVASPAVTNDGTSLVCRRNQYGQLGPRDGTFFCFIDQNGR